MRLSIVWRCAIAVAVAQIFVFVIVSAVVLATGFAPLYREWSDRAAETLRAHHELVRDIADRSGFRAAVAAAAKLSTTDLEYQVLKQARLDPSAEYMGMTGAQWLEFAENQQEPVALDRWLRWITVPPAAQDEVGQREPIIVLSSTRAPMPRVLRTQPVGAALWIGGCLILAALIGGLVATWFTRPILRLRISVTQFAAGRLEARPDRQLQSRTDELGDLARDLTRMKDRIAGLVGAQRQLLDDVAHELRSPLARMNVAVELAKQTCSDSQSPDSNESKQFLARIHRECERLSDMVDRLLQLSALEHRVDGDERIEINLTQLTREVAEDCDFEAQAVDRRVHLQADQDIRVLGNDAMIRTAIENIVRNAIRYTPAGTSVHIAMATATDQPERALITIRDHGPGVSEAVLPKLFQPFYRVESDRSNESGGAGLGLALADRAVRAHAGTITARNHAQGGLEFIIDLPAQDLRSLRSVGVAQTNA
jgi:signal transduction histidine kinase